MTIELLYWALCAGALVILMILIPSRGKHASSAPVHTANAEVSKFPRTAQDVLVGTLRNREQLDVCLQCGFYHIPCEQVPDAENPIRYIAIYQSITLFGEQAGIRYYGRVSECITVPRYQITQVYSESDELYYVFRVTEWVEHPAAVLPKETAFISKRTNLFCLLHSVEVPQLWVESREEFALYGMLYKASVDKTVPCTMDINGRTVCVRRNRIFLHQGKNLLWSCPLDAFNETPYSVMQCLRGHLQ